MKFILNINCDNAAFDEEPQFEVARILRDLVGQVEWSSPEDRHFIRDLNGNLVGTAEFVTTYAEDANNDLT